MKETQYLNGFLQSLRYIGYFILDLEFLMSLAIILINLIRNARSIIFYG